MPVSALPVKSASSSSVHFERSIFFSPLRVMDRCFSLDFPGKRMLPTLELLTEISASCGALEKSREIFGEEVRVKLVRFFIRSSGIRSGFTV